MKGIYILKIDLKKDFLIKIGALGKILFKKGTYLYIGSAQNNLEKRISRHFLDPKEKRLHWHIDYLLKNKNTELKKAFYKELDKKHECILAKKLSKDNNSIKKFGCSDCNCKSHLIRTDKINITGFKEFIFS